MVSLAVSCVLIVQAITAAEGAAAVPWQKALSPLRPFHAAAPLVQARVSSVGTAYEQDPVLNAYVSPPLGLTERGRHASLLVAGDWIPYSVLPKLRRLRARLPQHCDLCSSKQVLRS